ncbi:MAG: RNA-binding protein [Mucilaginibacter sp.]|uniref:RNA recognition motif domain-containing protein n=1 Tax=Mucilaginibacter sp. TaxID=1882438 RepID=UPI0031A7AE47
MIKLFVGGFPLEMTELDLVKLFNLHGDVVTIKIVRDKKTKICKGYAFLEMKDQQSADNAILALDNYFIGDRQLSVKIREDKPVLTRPKTGGFSPRPRPSHFKPGQPTEEPRKKRPRKIN